MPAPLSIVVPTRDRLAPLGRCLAALLAQQTHAEILVVDDASRDGTGRFLAGLEAEGRIRVLDGQGHGPAAARNRGIQAARGEIIACTDDDCLVPSDWAARLARRLEETGAAAAGGRVIAAADGRFPARLSQAITNGLLATLNRESRDAVFLTSNNVAYRAGAVRAAGLFDEGFQGAGGEERELHGRLRARGERLVYAHDIVVAHHQQLDWRGFLRQQASYGRGARLFYARCASLGPSRPRGLSSRAHLRFLLAALRELPARERALGLAGFLLSQLALAWGYARGSDQ